MGNRGILHDENRHLAVYPNTDRVPWKTKAWITCSLEFRGRKRQVMSPGRYTELFFLDEATAFSAGHRPCAECRRQAYTQFKTLWIQAHGDLPIDQTLHEERTNAKGNKRTHSASAESLPSGTFIVWQGDAWLLWNDCVLKWSSGGYVEKVARDVLSGDVEVLTPPSIVAVFVLGYRPHVHVTALE